MPTVPTGSQLTANKCVLAGTPDNIVVLYFWTFHTPSSGLQPESSTTAITAIGVTDKNFRKEAIISPEIYGLPTQIFPTEGATVARYSGGAGAIVAFSPASLAVVWRTQDDGVNFDYDRSTFLVQQSLPETRVIIRDAASGRVLLDNIDESYITNTTSDPHSMSTGYFIERYRPKNNSVYYFNPENGSTIELGVDQPAVTEQVDETLLVNMPGREGPESLKLYDIGSGLTLFGVEGADFAGIADYRFANYRNYLYIANDSDSPVIDVTTRKKLSDGWRIRPVQDVGDEWVLVQKGRMDTEQCFFASVPTSCTDQDGYTLQRVGSNGYQGPFY
ncbi:hypothetical protein [Williamsia soli]|uniref:hypothetical protein n=1 Tax=Williamsia soli TaxID=364929 RepID=UPI001A9D03CE|nr:hypothetical protein [Williamsia soli]